MLRRLLSSSIRPLSSSSSFHRTHLVESVPQLIDARVQLSGWLQTVRKRSDGAFAVLRDHTGTVQLYAEGSVGAQLLATPIESALSVVGTVVRRPEAAVKHNTATGAVELAVSELAFCNPCTKALPFPVADAGKVAEDVRLRHRFLDLRSPQLQHNLRARAEVAHAVRSAMRTMRFTEVETPYLFRPTPEGAKEFLVRTRWPGLWYSLPQSPQQYKQLLMMGGMDRYFQIARCFRDEDMRAERQPEFTQVDLEMAFAEERDVMDVTETIVQAALRALHGDSASATFSTMPYRDAMRWYGCDKPDLRIASRIESLVDNSRLFTKTLHLAGAPAAAALNKALTDDKALAALVNGKWRGAYAALSENTRERVSALHGKGGGVTLVRSGPDEMALCVALGKLRLALDPVPDGAAKRWLWVTEFPMFERSAEGEWKAAHHPFTAPRVADEHLVRDGGAAAHYATARAYDMVLNGVEVGGGSVRIHDAALQLAALRLIGVEEAAARSSLGHLLGALEMGAPPHAGLAFGLDRLMMGLLDASSLKDVIAFPKAADGKELMVGSPSALD